MLYIVDVSNLCKYFVFCSKQPIGNVPVEPDFKSPSKILAELNEYNQQQKQQKPQKSKQPLDYRFSIGQLPKWAKTKVSYKYKVLVIFDNCINGQKTKWAIVLHFSFCLKYFFVLVT